MNAVTESPKEYSRAASALAVVETLLRRVLLAGGFNSRQNANTQEYDCAYHNPVQRHVQYKGAVRQPADDKQKTYDIDSE